MLIRRSNAEAGLALICTCLPAFVGQFKFLRSRVRYGSSRTTTELHDTASGSGKLGTSKSAHHGTGRKRYQNDCSASLDEIELVPHAERQGLTHAQGNATPDRDTEQVSGIVRKLEVTHAVSYAIDDTDRSSKAESR